MPLNPNPHTPLGTSRTFRLAMAATAAAAALDGSARRRTAYARTELEALRGAPSEEALARLWTEVRAALVAAGCSGEYDGLLAAEDEEPRSRRGSKGRKAAGGGGAGAGRKWGEEAAAAAPPFSGRVLLRESSPQS